MEYVIFSKRQQQTQGGIPDTYPYEAIPDELAELRDPPVTVVLVGAHTWKENK